jgi:hypothetical protein
MAEYTTPEQFAVHLRELRMRRRGLRKSLTGTRPPRQALSRKQRETVLAKPAGRCHICGGVVAEPWQADHVLAHSGGGGHIVDNYLPGTTLLMNSKKFSSSAYGSACKLSIERRWGSKQRPGI